MLEQIAKELQLKPFQVEAVVSLIEEGGTIPFIARYRKERTGNLDEVQIRDVRDRYEYLVELGERKEAVLASITEQGKLTPELQKALAQAETKQSLEDLYLPYKPKRRTRATLARELGLEPLAKLIVEQKPTTQWVEGFQREHPELSAGELLSKARDIVAEWVSELAETRERLRKMAWGEGVIFSQVKKDYAEVKTKFEQYYEYQEPVRTIPAHRFLAIRRGEEEAILRLKFALPSEAMLELLKSHWVDSALGHAEQLESAIEGAYSRLLEPALEVELRLELKTRADDESIVVFGQNLKDLLLAPLGGQVPLLGLDPGFRTGSKWVVIDPTGKLLDYGTIFPVASSTQKAAEAKKTILAQAQKHRPAYICLGNGTASREVFSFLRALLKEAGVTACQPIIVSESGASVYSASDLAREEFPELDVSYRGAISIARRFQDPLAELVKIDPKSIGVGQYQHDVNQRKLKRNLDEAVESAVNFVGVNLNTASYSLLAYVSGLNESLAKGIVHYRDQHGGFQSRKELLQVARFGPKAFEQSAGFLRILKGANPLDGSAVHPENYALVETMAKDLGLGVKELVLNEKEIQKIKKENYYSEQVGSLTIQDILRELARPGRDPRSSFKAPKLLDEVTEITDLQAGMKLEGRVTNMTKFGVFVDIGVHQDGLIHISELADQFVGDPTEVCQVGQVISVTVLAVEVERKRISLSARKNPATLAVGGKQPQGQAALSKGPQPVATGNFQRDLKTLQEKFRLR